jgi:hypothetical protein
MTVSSVPRFRFSVESTDGSATSFPSNFRFEGGAIADNSSELLLPLPAGANLKIGARGPLPKAGSFVAVDETGFFGCGLA